MFQPHRTFLALAALSLAFAPACYTTPGSHTIDTFNNVVSYPLKAGADIAIGAAREVAREMSLTEVTFNSTRESGWLMATDASDVVYEFRTESNGDGTCSISVRVGSTGDRKKSIDLIDRVRAKL